MARNEASKLNHRLRQLTSSDERTRKQALRDVWMHLCHQGWVHDITADTVPYLIEVLKKPHLKGKEDILELLADIAVANTVETWKWYDEGGEGERPVTKAHLAVGAGTSIFVTLLDASNVTIQLEAAHVLSYFPEQAQELEPPLVQAYVQSKDVQVQANLILALGDLLAPREDEYYYYFTHPTRHKPPVRNQQWIFFEHIRQTTNQELLIFCASLVIARCAGKNAPQEVALFLEDVMTAQNLSEELRIFEKLPCASYYSPCVTNAAKWAIKELE